MTHGIQRHPPKFLTSSAFPFSDTVLYLCAMKNRKWLGSGTLNYLRVFNWMKYLTSARHVFLISSGKLQILWTEYRLCVQYICMTQWNDIVMAHSVSP